jgi:peptide/nickel transport system substrate-binding protein
VTIGHSSKPDIINPILTSETISVNLMNLIFSDLVKFDSAGRPIPDLAEGWQVSEDGLVWTFFIRDDVSFHDGHPLTAYDVEFTYRAIMDLKNRSPLAERYGLVDEVAADGDYIFRIVLKYPCASLLHRLSRAIAPKHLLANADLHDTPRNRHPVGSGPFRLVDWAEDDTIILDANRAYFHEDRPILDRLVFRAYPDRKAALQAITRGEIDVTRILLRYFLQPQKLDLQRYKGAPGTGLRSG